MELNVVLRLSSYMVSNSDDEINFPHKSLLTNRQTLSLRKSFNNHTSADIKFSKTKLTKNAKKRVFKNFDTIIKIRITSIKICS